MSYDRRYPHLVPVERPLPRLAPWEAAHARDIAGVITRRTGTRCFYNIVTGRLFFVYGDEPHGGPLSLEFRRGAGCRRYERHEIDDAAWYIQHGRASRREKDRLAANEKAAEEHAKEQHNGRLLEGNRRNAVDYADFLSRKRRGVAKTAIAV